MFQLRLNNVMTLFVLTLFMFSAQLCAEESIKVTEQTTELRTITLKGKIDPRLYAWVISRYRPTDLTNKEKCLSKKSNWGTGTKKALPDWKVVVIIPDKNNNYEVTVPIDHVGEDKCDYEYFDTEIKIRRDKNDELYASFTIASNNRASRHVNQGDKSGYSGVLGLPVMPENTKKYFQLPSRSQIICYTTFFSSNDRTTFTCYEEYVGADNGTDVLRTNSINLDIIIDEERSQFVFPYEDIKNRGKKKKDYFRDYKPEFIERLKQKLNTLSE